MQLDWSTVVLEVLNFLVLVWLLQRFFDKPIVGVVAARQAAIEQTTKRAREAEDKAHALQTQYEARLQNWEGERAKARSAMQAELQAERERALVALAQSLEQERERSRVLEERRQAEQTARSEERALAHAGAFVSRLLGDLASPELEAKLLQLAVDELPRLTEEHRVQLREALKGAHEPITVTSAYPLAPAQQEALSKAVEHVLGGTCQCVFREDRALLAGIRINAGSWVLNANLGEDMNLFIQSARDEH